MVTSKSSATLPQIHVVRADGGYEMRDIVPADILAVVNALPLPTAISTVVQAVEAFPLNDAVALFQTLARAIAKRSAPVDAEVAGVETAADVAEAAKLGAE